MKTSQNACPTFKKRSGSLANTKLSSTVGLMLAHRLRRWPKINQQWVNVLYLQVTFFDGVLQSYGVEQFHTISPIKYVTIGSPPVFPHDISSIIWSLLFDKLLLTQLAASCKNANIRRYPNINLLFSLRFRLSGYLPRFGPHSWHSAEGGHHSISRGVGGCSDFEINIFGLNFRGINNCMKDML